MRVSYVTPDPQPIRYDVLIRVNADEREKLLNVLRFACRADVIAIRNTAWALQQMIERGQP